MLLPELHTRLAWVGVLYPAVVGLWGLYKAAGRQEMDRGYWGALLIIPWLFVAQGALGVVLFASGPRPARTDVHLLYGAVGILTIPAARLTLRSWKPERPVLIYALLALFLAGVALRGIATGG